MTHRRLTLSATSRLSRLMGSWGATHSTAAAAKGLDMEMPMAFDPGAPPHYFDEKALSALPAGVVDAAAERVVARKPR